MLFSTVAHKYNAPLICTLLCCRAFFFFSKKEINLIKLLVKEETCSTEKEHAHCSAEKKNYSAEKEHAQQRRKTTQRRRNMLSREEKMCSGLQVLAGFWGWCVGCSHFVTSHSQFVTPQLTIFCWHQLVSYITALQCSKLTPVRHPWTVYFLLRQVL